MLSEQEAMSSCPPSFLSEEQQGNINTPTLSRAERRARQTLFQSPLTNPEEQSLFAKAIEDNALDSGSDSGTKELARTSEFLGNNQENNTTTMSTLGRFSSMFTLTTERTLEQLDAGRVSIPRANRGAAGKDRNKVKSMATAGLEPKFGVPKHFVVGEGESEDRASKIQDSFMSLAQQTKRL